MDWYYLELREKFTRWKKPKSFITTRANLSALRANSFVVVEQYTTFNQSPHRECFAYLSQMRRLFEQIRYSSPRSLPLRHHMTVTWRSCHRDYAWQIFTSGDIAPVLGVILHFFGHIHEHSPQNYKVRHGYISYRVPWIFCAPISLWSCLQVPYARSVWWRSREIWEIQVQLNVNSPSNFDLLVCTSFVFFRLACSTVVFSLTPWKLS